VTGGDAAAIQAELEAELREYSDERLQENYAVAVNPETVWHTALITEMHRRGLLEDDPPAHSVQAAKDLSGGERS